MVDLSGHYNTSLQTIGATLPNGLQVFGGTTFDVGGLIQLSSLQAKARGSSNPEQVAGIKIGRKCRRLHFLHATKFEAKDGTTVGTYVVHYADNQTREFPIVYGKDLRTLRTLEREPPNQPVPVWMGSSAEVQSSSESLRLFKSTWPNPLPDDEVLVIDFFSSMSDAAPILLAISVD